MSGSSRRAEFFALEAREYLTELEPLARAHELPDAERLVRGARALRGASLMAGLGTFARAAAGLEGIARQVRDNSLAWEPDARTAWREGLELLKTLVTRATAWEASDDRQALGLADRLERVVGGQAVANPVPPTSALTPGVRAFIARESALIAGSLEQAARALAPLPPPAALAAVLERMQSLRGLNASVELSPLPELLDAMEVATRTLLADVPPPPDVGAVFADAAHALAAMARSVAETGRVTQLVEVDRVAARLLESYAVERDVVPIAALAPEGMESVIRRGTLPNAADAADPVPVELISVGDHLLLTADALSQVPSTAVRNLRLFVLHRTLMTMPPRSGTGRFLSPLTDAITTAIGDGIAVREMDEFVKMLRECGRFLVDSGGNNDGPALARQRDMLAARLITVELGDRRPRTPIIAAAIPEIPPKAEPVVPISAPAVAASQPELEDVVSIASLGFTDAPPEPEDVVSITSLEFADAPPEPDEIVPIGSLEFAEAPSESEEVVPIESLEFTGAPLMLEDVVSIESLAPAEEPEEEVVGIETLAFDEIEERVIPIADLFPDEPPRPMIPEVAPGEPSPLEVAYARRAELDRQEGKVAPSLDGLIAMRIVPVETLLYRGGAAWARADEVRREIRALLDGPGISLEQVRPYLSELLDLVPLARAND